MTTEMDIINDPRQLFRRLAVFLLLLVAISVSASQSEESLRAKMDSVRSKLPSLSGHDRRLAWTRLYYIAYNIDRDTLSYKILDEWAEDAKNRGDYYSASVAMQNKIVDCYNSSQYETVRSLGEEAKRFNSSYNNWRKYFEAWHLMISSYHIQGYYNTAILEGKKMHEEAIKKNNVFGQAMAYYNMGYVYFTMRHFNQSADALKQSISLLANGDSTQSVLLEVYPYYGDALEAKKDFQTLDAMTHDWWNHIQNMGKEEKQIDMPSTLANYYIGRTQALLGLGQKEEARKALKDAEANITDSTTYEWIYLLYYKAQIAMLDGQYDEALRMNAERIRLCDVIEDKPTLLPVHLQKAEILFRAGRYKEAAESFKAAFNLEDSLNTQQTREQLNEMNTIFQVDDLKMQNIIQRGQYTTAIATLLVLALVIFLVHRLIISRKLKQKNDELAKSNAELQIAKEKALESSKMKTAFISSISHEIRTPLNILNGFTQVLIDQGGQMSEEEKESVSKNVQENSKRISELVNKMLEMSETITHNIIERNDTVPAIQIANDAIVISGITHTTSPDEPASPVSFILKNNVPDDLMIRTEQSYAKRALRHLLENGRKFTRQGSVTLIVEEREDTVAFIVEDTGIGVPEEYRESIFGEFVKLDDYASGTGIGLPLALNIARKLGGDIVLDSDYSGGSRFIMTLPK